MSIAQELEWLKLKLAQAEITAVCVTDETLTVELTDGRTITVPIVRILDEGHAHFAGLHCLRLQTRGGA